MPGLECSSLTKSIKNQVDKTKPLPGGVRHDARGNAVWQWASETARHAAATTSQLLRKLDVSSLSLQDEDKEARRGRSQGGKFDPYDGAARPAPKVRHAAPLAGKRPAPAARVRVSWWRRLLKRS